MNTTREKFRHFNKGELLGELEQQIEDRGALEGELAEAKERAGLTDTEYSDLRRRYDDRGVKLFNARKEETKQRKRVEALEKENKWIRGLRMSPLTETDFSRILCVDPDKFMATIDKHIAVEAGNMMLTAKLGQVKNVIDEPFGPAKMPHAALDYSRRLTKIQGIVSDTRPVLAVVKTTAREDQTLPPNSTLHNKLHVSAYFDGKHPVDVTVVVFGEAPE